MNGRILTFATLTEVTALSEATLTGVYHFVSAHPSSRTSVSDNALQEWHGQKNPKLFDAHERPNWTAGHWRRVSRTFYWCKSLVVLVLVIGKGMAPWPWTFGFFVHVCNMLPVSLRSNKDVYLCDQMCHWMILVFMIKLGGATVSQTVTIKVAFIVTVLLWFLSCFICLWVCVSRFSAKISVTMVQSR